MSSSSVNVQLPLETWTNIASHLSNNRDVAHFSAVCRLFKSAVDSKTQLQQKRAGIYGYVFGKSEWKRYFPNIGDIGKEPPLPPDIGQFLHGPCPMTAPYKVRESHLLTLIPSRVDGHRLTLKKLGELVKNPNEEAGGHPIKYKIFDAGDHEESHIGDNNAWVLMTRNVLLDSRGTSYERQCELVANLALKCNRPYKVPRLIEVVTSLFMDYVRSGTRYYGGDQRTYTSCQEQREFVVPAEKFEYTYSTECRCIIGRVPINQDKDYTTESRPMHVGLSISDGLIVECSNPHRGSMGATWDITNSERS